MKTENKKQKIYKVLFLDPPSGGSETEFYFGSLRAIYDVFTPEQIGCKVENLWNKGLSSGGSWSGSKCTISLHEMVRQKTRRGGRVL